MNICAATGGPGYSPGGWVARSGLSRGILDSYGGGELSFRAGVGGLNFKAWVART